MNRELIYSTLADLLMDGDVFQTKGRRKPQGFDAIPKLPAIFVIEADESYPGATGALARTNTRPALITLGAEVWIFQTVADNDPAPGASLNPLEDGIEQKLKPARGVLQNLGLTGVIHCRLEGPVHKDVSAFAGFVWCRMPISIEVQEGIDTVAVA